MKEKNGNFIVIEGIRYSLSVPANSCNVTLNCRDCALKSFCDKIEDGPGLCELFPDCDDKIFVIS